MPVREYIRGLVQRDERDRCFEFVEALGHDAVVFGRGADVDHLGGGLYELRPGRHRILFGFVKGMAILLHAVPKKGRVLSRHDLDLARKRLKEVRDALEAKR